MKIANQPATWAAGSSTLLVTSPNRPIPMAIPTITTMKPAQVRSVNHRMSVRGLVSFRRRQDIWIFPID
jgi:hypothetical protein